jgi:diphthamide synthase (EF-2-diphthine--ammonia ligase)
MQAAALGLPLVKVPIPARCTNPVYEAAMEAAMARARAEGVWHVAFGDLFLEDIRRYRQEKLRAAAMTPIFPIWGRNTHALAREMTAQGLQARITCVDPKQLDRAFAGRLFDDRLLDELPVSADPCGENGEFHSFAFAGPMFAEPLRVAPGEVVERDGFVFADLLPTE